MALYPGAKKRLIRKHNRYLMRAYRRVNLHVTVSSASSQYGWFSQAATCSHFHVSKTGLIEQYIDTKYASKADLQGNYYTISIETQGAAPGSSVNGERWTEAQLASLVKLWVWSRKTHGIKNRIATGTRSDPDSLGLSWHRLGIQGNFGGRRGLASKKYGGSAGLLFSRARGKECPGDNKINQIPEIFARGNGKKPLPTPSKPVPSKPSKPSKKNARAVRSYSSGEILRIQKALKKMGYYKGGLDGDYGNFMYSGVMEYQRAQKFKPNVGVDGDWGPRTRKHYAWTKVLQGALKKWKAVQRKKVVPAVDGDYGSVTHQAVWAFQRGNKRGVYKGYLDGIPGGATCGVLGIPVHP